MSLLHPILSLAETVGHPIDVLLQAISRLPGVIRRRVSIAEQLYSGAIQGIHVVLLVGLFIGMIVSLQTGIELMRIGQQDQIGTVVAVTMAREMGPFITATILAATVGSAMAA